MLKIFTRSLIGFTVTLGLMLTGFAAWAAPAVTYLAQPLALSAEAKSVKLVAEMVAQSETRVADSLRSDLRKDSHGYRLASAEEFDGLWSTT